MFHKFFSQELGCLFQSINHGITGSFLDQIRSVTTQFFAFPMEEKMKYSREVDTPEARRLCK
jgi:isopenicillin N synthase-like dioxygenase